MAPPTPADRPSPLTLGPGAPEIRRTVGPIAWAVLECVATNAVERADEAVSYESVRGIADSLGLAKDTVARALRRLAGERLVAHVASRGHDGRFGPSHYRLDLPPDLFLVPCKPGPMHAPPMPSRPSRRPPATQLSLIDAVAPDP